MSLEMKFHVGPNDDPGVSYKQYGGARWIEVQDPETKIRVVIWLHSAAQCKKLATSILEALEVDPEAKDYPSS